MRTRAATGLLAAACLLVAGCGGTTSAAEPTPAVTVTPRGTTPSTSPTPPPEPGTVPPAWLGTRVLERVDGRVETPPTPPELRERRFTLPDRLPMLPGTGFAARTDPVPASVLARSTWREGCPVAAGDLRWVRLTFWGFDDARHTGELLVNRSVAADLVRVFRTLYEARFPIEEMRISSRAEQTAPPTGDANSTESFSCRPTTGASFWSQHAYGTAVDVNPFQNPYEKAPVVVPELARSYLDRGDVRPGMVLRGGVVERAFAAIGWGWGGDYRRLKDFQHFSRNGR